MPPFDVASAPRTKILVVDDQPANLLSMRAVLEPLDQEIIEARSGEQALRQLLQHNVSVVLLDIQMPGLDGFEVAKLIRGRDNERHTPIIFLTAFEDHRFTIPEAYSLGAVDYLVKPIVPEVLLAKVAFFVELYQKAELLKRLGYEEREKGEESEARKAAILETAMDGIITIDEESRIVEFNRAAEMTFGYRKEDILGQSMPELIMPARYREEHNHGLSRCRDMGDGPVLRRRIEVTALRADGTEFPIELAIVPHGNRARPLFTAYLRDITERKLAEEQLRSAVLREQERAEQLREADRRKDEFLAMLAHELRNPLAAVSNSLRIARTPDIGGDVLHWAQDVMERQIGLLTRLIDDLLDVSRITRGKIKLRKEVLALDELIRRAAEAARPQFDAKRQELIVSVCGDARLWIDADPARIEQILGNLLTNATKYTPEGGRIVLSAEGVNGEAVVRVTDNGIGIASEMLPRLFEPFAQADSSLDRAHGGLGIGLTLVRALAEMHGGSATATSDGEGRGSEFALRLPLSEVSAEEDEKSAPHVSSNSKRVLVVDDNRDAATSMAWVLKFDGHMTHVVQSGEEALNAFETFKPDVVLLDIGLPQMDGYEVATRLRQASGGFGPLLIAVTGYGQADDRQRSKAAGFDYHLVKPVDISALLALCAGASNGSRDFADVAACSTTGDK
jgi:PAS domain S-box-containing protein